MIRRAWLALGFVVLGCAHQADEGVVDEAAFGVFFGGQVQKLKAIPKELDPARQSHGFRLTFRGPLAKRITVSWEISLPAPDQAGPRPAIVGETSVPAGQTRLDVPFAFRPSDPLGAWHAKVVADGRVALDWDFSVVAPAPPAKLGQKSLPLRAAPAFSPPESDHRRP